MDILPYYDNASQSGGWSIEAGDVKTGPSLTAAVMVSLLSDRVAGPDWEPSAAEPDRHGWWGDDFADYPIGSRLWQLRRAKKSDSTQLLLQARDIVREALQWMIIQGIAADIDVQVAWAAATALMITARIRKPSGETEFFRYAYAWDEI